MQQFSGKNFYDFATMLLKEAKFSKDEAAIRSAISRFYYAVYLEARKKYSSQLEQYKRENGIDNDENAHKILADFLKSIEQRNLSKNLQEFKQTRNNADYDLKRSFSFKQAVDAQEQAKLILKYLDITV